MASGVGGGWKNHHLIARFKKDRIYNLHQIMDGKQVLCQVTSRHCTIEQCKTIARLMCTLLSMDGYSVAQALAVRDQLLSGAAVEIHWEKTTLQALHENLEAADAEHVEAHAAALDVKDLGLSDPRDLD